MDELRDTCNKLGISCKDLNGKLLTEEQLALLLSKKHSSAKEMTLLISELIDTIINKVNKVNKDEISKINDILNLVFTWKLFSIPVAIVLEKLSMTASSSDVRGILYKVYENTDDDDKFLFLDHIDILVDFYTALIKLIQTMWGLELLNTDIGPGDVVLLPIFQMTVAHIRDGSKYGHTFIAGQDV